MDIQPRMVNPALGVPGLLEALQNLAKATNDAAQKAGIPRATIDLVDLRASQINGCAVCLDLHTRGAKMAGEQDERLFTLSAWRDAPYFSDAERAALALTEATTRLCDQSDPVPDEIFNEAARHYDESGLAALIASIGLINLWNRCNVASRQITGEWTAQWVS